MYRESLPTSIVCGFESRGSLIIITTEGPDGEIAHWQRMDYGYQFEEIDNELYLEAEILSAVPFRSQMS